VRWLPYILKLAVLTAQRLAHRTRSQALDRRIVSTYSAIYYFDSYDVHTLASRTPYYHESNLVVFQLCPADYQSRAQSLPMIWLRNFSPQLWSRPMGKGPKSEVFCIVRILGIVIHYERARVSSSHNGTASLHHLCPPLLITFRLLLALNPQLPRNSAC